MKRMHYHHHKFALSLTIVLVAVIGVALGNQIYLAGSEEGALAILTFSFLMVLSVITFILLSILLRTREELHAIHADLSACLSATTKQKSVSKGRKK